MAITFEPPFAITPLHQVPAGVPIIFEGRFGFTAVNQSAPNPKPITLALYDPEQRKFLYRHFNAGSPNILVPRGGVVLSPNLYKLTDNVTLQPATNQLFKDGDEAYIVVQLPNGTDIRLLNLKDGSLVAPTTTSLPAFVSWEVAVNFAPQRYFSLLKI